MGRYNYLTDGDAPEMPLMYKRAHEWVMLGGTRRLQPLIGARSSGILEAPFFGGYLDTAKGVVTLRMLYDKALMRAR